jgi:[citrate (pro-3S)-lyase] ligase
MKEMSRIWLHNALNSPKDDSTLSSSDLLYRDFGSLQARLSNVEKNLDDVKKAQKLMRDASLKMPEDQNETARADVNLIDSGDKIHRFNAILGSCGGTIFDYFTAKGINEVALYSNNPSLALIWEQAYHLDIKITHIISDSLNEITLKYPREGKLPTVKPDGSDVNVPVIILSEGVKAPNSFKQHYNATDLFLFAYFKRTLFDYLVDFNEKHSEIPLFIVNHPQISSISNPSEIEREILKINPDYEKINKAVFYDSGKTKEYRNQVMRLFDSVQRDGTLVFRDMDDETRKVVNGKLVTSDVPDNADRIIYFFGNSYCAGLGADYAHTVCSALQRKLNSCGLNPPEFAVCNTVNSCGLNPLEMRKSFQKEYIYSGDVAVFYAIFNGLCHEVYGSRFSWVETQSEFDRPHEHGELFVDKDNHLNERGYDLVAENLHRSLNGNGILSHAAKLERKAIVQNNATIRLDGNLEKLLGDYLAGLYQYKTAGKIGSIVMNCNPFTLGHRYLVEYAASKVDSLIIFVVEEDKSIFPFADRFELVKKGTSDLSNVTVIPSGKFIISQMTFKSYFIKDEVKNSVIDPSGDVEIFAQRIAPALGITVRFAGEEPLDNVTRQYNSAMRRILPHYGIVFEVIPRKQFGDSVISASRVRAMLKTKDFGGIAKIVPETTLEYLKNKILQGVRI